MLLLAGVLPAHAQDAPPVLPDGSEFPTGTSAPPASSATTGPSLQPGEVAKGSAKAMADITSIFASVVDTAVTASQSIRTEADRFAFGLAVITIVLAAVKFSAANHPVTAWVALFEELAVLGIFAALYLGYAGWAPNLYKWFLSLAHNISGADMTSAASVISNTGGKLLDGFILAFDKARWYEYPALLKAVFPLLLAWAVTSITSLVFLFFINVGQLQMSVGFVLGQIALALGFSTFTRGWFKSWLDYMISAGMYVVVAAALARLVSNTLIDRMTSAAGNSSVLTTPGMAAYVFDLSILVFLLSFEIPKMAAMFGGGASANGAMLGKLIPKPS